jgi:2-dehydropantoate 2-reductase
VHVVVLGAGGLGCVVGAQLAESGVAVTLVARAVHVGAIRRDGLHLSGIHGDRFVRDRLRPVTEAREVDTAVDYLLLVTKTRDTEAALAGAECLRDRVGTALSLQNSVTKDDVLAGWIGEHRVIGATTTESGTLVGPGAVRHTATAPTAFCFGELDGTLSERVIRLADAFTAARMSARPATEIRQAEWEKLLQIAIVAGFSASTLGFKDGVAFAHGIAVRPGAEHYVTIATELLAVYRAMGYEPCDFFAPYSQFRSLGGKPFDAAVDDTLALGAAMIAAGTLGRPPLHDDILRGRPTEVDDSLGHYLATAERCGVPTPTMRGAYRVIKTLEALA